jgi:hypothetical protein
VQNADGNSYRTDVEPFIRFVRRNDLLLVQNNEIGFEEKHVRAVQHRASVRPQSRMTRSGSLRKRYTLPKPNSQSFGPGG